MKRNTMIGLAIVAAAFLYWRSKQGAQVQTSGLNQPGGFSLFGDGVTETTYTANPLPAKETVYTGGEWIDGVYVRSMSPGLGGEHPRDYWGNMLIARAKQAGYRFATEPRVCEMNTKEGGPHCNYDNPAHVEFMKLVRHVGEYWSPGFRP